MSDNQSDYPPHEILRSSRAKDIQRMSLGYELPMLLKDTQLGRISTFQSSATVSALYAALEGQLLVFVKGIPEEEIHHTSSGYQSLVALTYAALFFSISATVGSLMLTDQWAELNTRAAVKEDHLHEYKKISVADNMEDIIEKHGMKKSYRHIRANCTCDFM
ncbi:hypothetical protein FRC12_009323 [Ceratobasidium sp. 428]|nr:hypothetical protein FRC12_009323 [Ceratobasidium sp. 428]